MKRYIAIAAIVVNMWTVHEAAARIGETPEQCRARYGDPIDKDKDILVFKKVDILIAVWFYNGEADMILYSKAAGFSDNEIYTLCKLNGDARRWTQISPNSMYAKWRMEDDELNEIEKLLKQNGCERERKEGDKTPNFTQHNLQTEDGALFACSTITIGTVFIIVTKDHAPHRAAEKKARENKNLDGF